MKISLEVRRFTVLLITLSSLSLVTFAGCQSREISKNAPGEQAVSKSGKLVFEDAFDREELGEQWRRGEGEGGPGQWRIEDGWVVGDRIRNDPLWLAKPLPAKVRIEFEAEALTPTGDIKVEVFGDGERHESGYILIFGGWKNSLDVIARLDEHGDDRKARTSQQVTPNQVYEMAIERTNGTVRWFVDGKLFMTYEDDAPLQGDEHAYFAFNIWDAPVRFRNVRVFSL